MTASITAENLGPLSAVEIGFNGKYGIHVFSAPNGSGKSLFLDAAKKLASGGGKVPLKDGAKKGSIEGFGARISIGQTCRHTGEFEVVHLEGRFDLSKLVDPGLKTPDAADRQRIRALVTICGAVPSLETFAKHPALKDNNFSTVVGTKAAACTDLCEMADQIAKDYQTAARAAEEQGKKFRGSAFGLAESNKGIDLEGECDSAKLQGVLERAIEHQGKINERASAAIQQANRVKEAEERLKSAKAQYSGPTVAEAEAKRDTASAVLADCTKRRMDAEEAVRLAAEDEAAARRKFDDAGKSVMVAKQVYRVIEECEQLLAQGSDSPLSPQEWESAVAETEAARKAVEHGQTIRDARQRAEQAKKALEGAAVQDAIAEGYREAGKAVDMVLSDAIHNDYLRVESVDGKARLVCSHPKRGTIPFDELSAGEKWRIAIDLASDLVGEDGLIVIEQDGWEGIDAFVRPEIHAHAVARKVYVLTAEATRNIADGRAPKVMPFDAAVVEARIDQAIAEVDRRNA